MAIVLIAHPLLRRVYQKLYSTSPALDQGKGHAGKVNGYQPLEADARLKQRTDFDLYFALVFLTALYGVSVFKILIILYTNFCIATRLPKPWIPPATWIFNIGVLFANEFGQGYPLVNVVSSITPFSNTAIEWAKALDKYGGLIGRWEVLFNITMLRLISFNMDYYWSLDRRAGSSIEV